MKTWAYPFFSFFLLPFSLSLFLQLCGTESPTGSNKLLKPINLIKNSLSVSLSLRDRGVDQSEREVCTYREESDTDSYEEELAKAIEMSNKGYERDDSKDNPLKTFEVNHKKKELTKSNRLLIATCQSDSEPALPIQGKKRSFSFVPEAVNKEFSKIICLFLPDYYPSAQKLFRFLYVELLNIIHGHLGLVKFCKKKLPDLCDFFLISASSLQVKSEEEGGDPKIVNSGYSLKRMLEQARLNGTEDKITQLLAKSLKSREKITVGYAYSGLRMTSKEKEVLKEDKEQKISKLHQFPWPAKLRVNQNFAPGSSFFTLEKKGSLVDLTPDQTLEPNKLEYLSGGQEKNLSELFLTINKDKKERDKKREKEFSLYWKQEEEKLKKQSSLYGFESICYNQELLTKQNFFLQRGYTWDSPAFIFPIFAFCIPQVLEAAYNSCVPFYGKGSQLNFLIERGESMKSQHRERVAKFLPSAKSIIKRGGRYFLLTTSGWKEMESHLQDQLRDFEFPKDSRKKQNLTTLMIDDEGAIHKYLLILAEFLVIIDFGNNNGGIYFGFVKTGFFSFTKKDNKLLETYLMLANKKHNKNAKPFFEEKKTFDRLYDGEDIYEDGDDDCTDSSSEESL